MKTKIIYGTYLLGFVILITSCSPKFVSTNYYYQNEKVLDSIEQSYKKLYQQKSFALGFTNKDFKMVSINIITDSLTYIYEFDVNEPRMTDTLIKYKMPAKGITDLINSMQSIHCTWINNLDYYVDKEKKSVIFISIRPIGLQAPLSYKKYYILTYFAQKQYFDNKGRLLANRKVRRLNKINGEVFKRINDRVCYTVSTTFR